MRCTGAWLCASPAAASASWSRWRVRWPAKAPGTPARAAGRPGPPPARRRSAPPGGPPGAVGGAGGGGGGGGGGDRGSAGLTKFIPLAHWTWGDLWHYIAPHGVDYNPLHDRFYPSIGCAPCTRAISLGEDLRSGRWWWEQESAKECGLHAKPDTPTVTRQKALP